MAKTTTSVDSFIAAGFGYLRKFLLFSVSGFLIVQQAPLQLFLLLGGLEMVSFFSPYKIIHSHQNGV
jgi:hypothetical protein